MRTYEFATLYADVLKGNFQLYTLQWVGGALADPGHPAPCLPLRQVPPSGFNRGYFSDPRVDRLLDGAAGDDRRGAPAALYGEVQRIVAEEAPYISLWCKTNVAVAQRTLTGVRYLHRSRISCS